MYTSMWWVYIYICLYYMSSLRERGVEICTWACAHNIGRAWAPSPMDNLGPTRPVWARGGIQWVINRHSMIPPPAVAIIGYMLGNIEY